VTTKAEQDIRYWLTPAGCATAGEHRADLDGNHCRVCGTRLNETAS
jgi:hypothetical protein